MKKLIAILVVLFLVFGIVRTAYSNDAATSTDLRERHDFTVTMGNLYYYNIVAIGDAHLNGHVRGSIFVGGTLTSGEWKFVDDGSLNGVAASDSYVYNNNSSVQFKGRTSEQGPEAYYSLGETSTGSYWRNIINNPPEGWIYVKPNDNGYVDLRTWDYVCPGDDTSQSTIEKIYWTDATLVDMGGLAGHLIAPYADVRIVSCNHCGSVVGMNITSDGESHINYWNPSNPPAPTPTPTPPVDITINKTLIGSVWHIRCDYMDGITFKAGGGIWRRDWIKNPAGQTSKEGHRSNKCGDADNWVIWVDANGNPFRMDEIKSGSTGGTLPTIIYEPRYPMTAAEILAMENGDPDTIWRYSQNFIDVKDWSTIKVGERLYWTTQNGSQVWYHTGVPYKVESPTYTIYIDGQAYNLIANGNSVTIKDLEAGIHTIVEETYGDSYVSAIYVDGVALSDYSGSINITIDTTITVENTLITPPPTTSPTPPPTPVVPTPTPTPTPEETETPTPTPEETETPTPTPEETETPSPTPEETETPTITPEETETPTPTPEETETPTPTPEETETPTPTPEESETPTPEVTETPTPTPEEPSPSPDPTCGFTIRKLVSNYEAMDDDAIFFFKIHGSGLEENEYIELTVDHTTGVGTYFINGLKPGKYTVEEVDIHVEYELESDPEITLYVIGEDTVFEFTNKLKEPEETPTLPPTTATPSEVPSETPTSTPTPTPTPTVTTSPIPSVTPSPTPTPTPMITPTRTLPPTTVTPSEVPTTTPPETPTPSPAPTVTTSPDPTDIPTEEPTDEPTEELTEEPTEKPTEEPTEKPTDEPVIPKVPEGQPQPKTPTRHIHTITIDEYETALGLGILINHVGDCFD